MPRHVKRDQRDLAYHQLFAVGNELVELRTVARELGAFVEYLPEHTLDGDDFPTDDELAAKLFLKIGHGRKVIGLGKIGREPCRDRGCPDVLISGGARSL